MVCPVLVFLSMLVIAYAQPKEEKGYKLGNFVPPLPVPFQGPSEFEDIPSRPTKPPANFGLPPVPLGLPIAKKFLRNALNILNPSQDIQPPNVQSTPANPSNDQPTIEPPRIQSNVERKPKQHKRMPKIPDMLSNMNNLANNWLLPRNKRPNVTVDLMLHKPNITGGVPWLLFPHNMVPGNEKSPTLKLVPELYEDAEHEVLTQRCTPGDQSKVFKKVAEPALIPFLLNRTDPTSTNAAVIIIPGGGYEYLSWEKEVLEAAEWLTSIGITAFALKYRVPLRTSEERMKGIIDGQRALSLVRANANDFGIDPDRIGVLGFGLGGELAMNLWEANEMIYDGIDANDQAGFWPNFVLMVYPHLWSAQMIKDDPPSPTPPVFITGTEDDNCTKSIGVLGIASFMSQYKPQILETFMYPNGGHGYGLCKVYLPTGQREQACEWPDRAAEFLDRYVLKLPNPKNRVRNAETGAVIAIR